MRVAAEDDDVPDHPEMLLVAQILSTRAKKSGLRLRVSANGGRAEDTREVQQLARGEGYEQKVTKSYCLSYLLAPRGIMCRAKSSSRG